jgi:hypothetical protein
MNHENPVGSQCTKCDPVPFCSKNDQANIWASKRQLKRHEVLHQPNNQFIHLYAIQDGALKTHETSQDGKEIIHGLYSPYMTKKSVMPAQAGNHLSK